MVPLSASFSVVSASSRELSSDPLCEHEACQQPCQTYLALLPGLQPTLRAVSYYHTASQDSESSPRVRATLGLLEDPPPQVWPNSQARGPHLSQPDPSTTGVALASRHLFCAAQGLLCMGQLSCLGRQLPLELFQLVTLLFHLGQDNMSVGQQGWEDVGGGAHTEHTFISDSRLTCSIWKASCSFTRATSSWLCCVTVSCLAVSAF